MREAGLSAYDADVLVAERATADFFEAVAKGRDAEGGGELGDQRAVRPPQQGRQGRSRPRRCRPAQLGAILDLIGEGAISGKIAKDLFEIVWTEGGDPRAIVEARGMKQVTDTGAIEKVVDEIIAQEPRQGRAGEGEAAARRLVRRPGDEGLGRQGQPAGGERAAQGEARALTQVVAEDQPGRAQQGDRTAPQ